MTATYSCLLKAWHRTVQRGLCLNPTQFLILCDVLENPAEKISASKRAKRLRLTQPTVSLALRFLATHGLATVIENTAPGGFTLTAEPTREAYQLFGLRGPSHRIDMPKPALFIPLRATYYDAFADGSKTDEFRLHGSRWNERTCPVGRSVILSRGYGKKHRLTGTITGFRVTSETTPAFLDCYPNAKDPQVAVISIKLNTAS